MQVISHTFPGGAELCAYLHEADESMPASLRCEQPAVIIFPGGGYAFTSPREADPVALAFLSMGYQTFILRYRTGESAGAKQPLEDAARSIAFVRPRKNCRFGLFGRRTFGGQLGRALE